MISEEHMHHASRDSENFNVEKLEVHSKVEVKIDDNQKDSDAADNAMFIIDDLGMQKDSKDLEKDGNGVNTPYDLCGNKESSVRVMYSSLPSHSKRKLEELLHNWAEWHAKHCTSSEEPVDSLESGDETYFPALHVGSDKPSTVSFSMDVQVRKRQRKETMPMIHDCSFLYERGYAVGLASDEGVSEGRAYDLREAPRCFNCGSYSHSLGECSKPRDNAAINSARKQFLSKKNQNAGPRVPTRYYQDSPAGKFDGLKPGALSAETKGLLGLGELDPPPWLNRMRELGYPPGYLGQDEEDPPSGITIFDGDGNHDGALRSDSTLDSQEPQKKMTVDFPGINASIPENADERRWAAAVPRGPPPAIDFPRNQSNRRHQHFTYTGIGQGPPGEYRPWNHFQSPSYHHGIGGSNPPAPHHPYNYNPTEPFSPRGVQIPANPNHGRSPDTRGPFLHYNYGSF